MTCIGNCTKSRVEKFVIDRYYSGDQIDDNSLGGAHGT